MKFNKEHLVHNIKKINMVLLLVFIFSMVTMRGVMNLVSAFLLVSSIILYFLEGRPKLFESKIWVLLILSYPLAVFLNFFSPAGLDGALNTLFRFYYVLIIFIYAVNNVDYENKNKFLLVFEIAMIIASLWSLYLYINPEQLDIHYPNNHNGIMRLRSFEAVGRWGIYLMMAIIIKYSQIFVEKNKFKQLYNILYLILLSYVLLLNNGRGPWLFTLVGLFIFIIFSMDKKVILFSIFLASIFITMFMINEKLNNYVMRFVSIADTTSNRSNTIRLETWKVGFDMAGENPISGIGYHKNQDYVLQYREKMKEYKNEDYKRKYLFYSWIIEGSYAALAAQNGYLYMLIYLFSIGMIILINFMGILKSSSKSKLEMCGIFSSVIAYLMLQQFYLDLQNYSTYLMYFILYILYKKNYSLVKGGIRENKCSHSSI